MPSSLPVVRAAPSGRRDQVPLLRSAAARGLRRVRVRARSGRCERPSDVACGVAVRRSDRRRGLRWPDAGVQSFRRPGARSCRCAGAWPCRRAVVDRLTGHALRARRPGVGGRLDRCTSGLDSLRCARRGCAPRRADVRARGDRHGEEGHRLERIRQPREGWRSRSWASPSLAAIEAYGRFGIIAGHRGFGRSSPLPLGRRHRQRLPPVPRRELLQPVRRLPAVARLPRASGLHERVQERQRVQARVHPAASRRARHRCGGHRVRRGALRRPLRYSERQRVPPLPAVELLARDHRLRRRSRM